MTLSELSATVTAVGGLLAALYYLGRRVLRGLEALLLAVVPVIAALSEVRRAWREPGRRAIEAADTSEEGERRVLP
ncbi:hypothetical protein [Kitasatospora sp. MBT66]|uniref:hypothetical protein n=1 Tax=Kitasatospora sp. MBT66 TaxID=1444769 RepID=UPI0005B9D5EE|nr:hypothetical protein [Kitasatospora sp. MBT66]